MSAWADAARWILVGILAINVAFQVLLFGAAVVALLRVKVRDRHRQWRRVLSSPLSPGISVILPAYNEGVWIEKSVRGVLGLAYPQLEVVVVNDGSSDDTLASLIAAFDLRPVAPIFRRSIETKSVNAIYRSPVEPRLIVVDKMNGGKADALNVGVNVASSPLVCAIDADTIIAPDALQELVLPFLEDDRTAAVGGSIRPANDGQLVEGRIVQTGPPRNIWAGAQTVEYLRAFLVGRLAWNVLGGNLIVSGAFGVFRREALIEAGGYQAGSVGEDMELVVRMLRRGYERGVPGRVYFSPDPVAWTEVPEDPRMLSRQRNRWYRGLLEVLDENKAMLGRRRYGAVGTVGLPYFALVEALAPMLEIAGIVLLVIGVLGGWVSGAHLVAVSLTLAIGLAATIGVLMMDDLVFATFSGTRNRMRLVAYAVFETFVFHPLTLVWRLQGLRLRLQGRSTWGVQVRKGLAS